MKQTTYYLFIVLIALSATTARAQSAYSMHTIEAGESLSNLAKSHHTTVGDIMRLNGMNAQSQLHVGDKIKIPASTTIVQPKPAAATPVPATSSPVTSANATTHVVATGETLYRISQLYKIPVEKLMALNNLQDGNVKVGQTLTVSEGVMPQQTPLKPKMEPASILNHTEAPQVKQNTVPKPAPVQQTPVTAPITATPVQQTNAAPQNNTPEIDVDNSSSQSMAYSSLADVPKEGFFTALYGKEVRNRAEKTKDGSSMTFKSASGWADKKYYILMNDVPSGTIVKLKSGKNELFAKVLWNLGDMKENDGLDFRISTAAAAALGISDQKFPLTVTYY